MATVEQKLQAAIMAGERMEEIVKLRNRTIASQEKRINSQQRLIRQLEGINSDNLDTINSQENLIYGLRKQVQELGQRLDAKRQNNRKRTAVGTAHGSIAIDSQYHKDNSPRN